jgi:hypothetical protein
MTSFQIEFPQLSFKSTRLWLATLAILGAVKDLGTQIRFKINSKNYLYFINLLRFKRFIASNPYLILSEVAASISFYTIRSLYFLNLNYTPLGYISRAIPTPHNVPLGFWFDKCSTV